MSENRSGRQPHTAELVASGEPKGAARTYTAMSPWNEDAAEPVLTLDLTPQENAH